MSVPSSCLARSLRKGASRRNCESLPSERSESRCNFEALWMHFFRPASDAGASITPRRDRSASPRHSHFHKFIVKTQYDACGEPDDKIEFRVNIINELVAEKAGYSDERFPPPEDHKNSDTTPTRILQDQDGFSMLNSMFPQMSEYPCGVAEFWPDKHLRLNGVR